MVTHVSSNSPAAGRRTARGPGPCSRGPSWPEGASVARQLAGLWARRSGLLHTMRASVWRAGADQNWYVTLVSSSEADQSRSAARRSRAGALRARAKKPPRHRERPLFSGRELAFKVIGFSDVIISGGHPGSERQLGDCQPDPVIQADWGCCIACSVARERVETVSRIVAAHLLV